MSLKEHQGSFVKQMIVQKKKRWQLSGQTWGQRDEFCSLFFSFFLAGDLFHCDRWKLLPVYWSRRLSQCPPVLTDRERNYTYTHAGRDYTHLKTHKPLHNTFISCQGVKSTTLMFSPQRFFSFSYESAIQVHVGDPGHGSAAFKHTWEACVRLDGVKEMLTFHKWAG